MGMTARSRTKVYLHVGSPKSGTTYLQSVLRQNADRLAESGVLVAGRSHTELVHAGLVIREDPRAEKLLDEDQRRSWQRVVDQVRDWPGRSVVISYELLSAASADQAARAIADLGDVEVHVVITARDLVGAVVSGWQERLKFKLTLPLEDVGPREQGEFGWLTLDPCGVAKRWGATLPAGQVHIVTAPADRGSAGDTLWDRFAAACGIDDIENLDLTDAVANESLSPVAAELLRRFNGRLSDVYPTSTDQAIWLRDTLAHQVLVPLGGESIRPSDEQQRRWHERGVEVVEALSSSAYRIHGDLADLVTERPGGRQPGQVGTEELLDAALEAMKGLLGLLSDAEEPEEVPVPGGIARAKRAVRRVGLRIASPALWTEYRRLERQVEAANRQIQEGRELHQRVADLDDIVAHLLLPADAGGDEAVARALKSYRESSIG